MRVSDLMSRDVVTIKDSDSCLEAVRRMARARIRHLPVVNGQGRLVGVVTDRNLRHHLFSPRVFETIGTVRVESLLKTVPVSDVMSAPVVTASTFDSLDDAARVMRQERVGSLPVVAEGRVVGILTETDMLRRIVAADGECDSEVEEIVVSFP
jgi:acetoin utilization protein AcuB